MDALQNHMFQKVWKIFQPESDDRAMLIGERKVPKHYTKQHRVQAQVKAHQLNFKSIRLKINRFIISSIYVFFQVYIRFH